MATSVAIVVGLALALDSASARAGFVDSLVLAFGLPLAAIGTVRAVGLWRGTVSHTSITYPPALMGMSLERVQAATPSAIVAMDGIFFAFALLILTGGDGTVASPLTLAGGAVFLVFTCAWICVAALLRPRLLLPATMRRA